MSRTAYYPSYPTRLRKLSLEKDLTWCLSLVLSVSVLLAPAIWNGFAVVYYDTGGYIERVLNMNLGFGRSFFYGVFLWVTSLNWGSFWGPAVIQALLSIWLIHLLLRCHGLPAGPFATGFLSAGLGISTGISWYTSQLMPDILVPLTVIVIWLFAFYWENLRRVEQIGLAIVALFGLMSHMSCMALAIGLIGILLLFRMYQQKCTGQLHLTIIPPMVIVITSLILMPMLHKIILGQSGYTPGGPSFIFGRLVQDKIAQRWLAEHCPAPGIELCNLQHRLPATGDAFLWDHSSPFFTIGGWSGAADSELSFLVKACLTSYPAETLWTSVIATAEQMGMVATGEGLDKYHHAARGTFNNALPQNVSRQFNAARQQQAQFTPQLFAAINLVHIPIALASTVGLLAVIGWGFYYRHRDIACLAVFTFAALIGNAFICGAMSGPHHRYQSRIVWLATFVVVMAIIHWWRNKGLRLSRKLLSKAGRQ